MNCFEQNGLAALSYVMTTECEDLFRSLEKQQTEFLAKEDGFRSEEYARKWPSDALHWWSRCWEYPFVMYHIKKLQQGQEKLKVLDFGSGVTFFSIAVARENFDVHAFDVDPLVAQDLSAAVNLVSPLPGTVSVSIGDGDTIPNADASIDILYSISVLEHLDNVDGVISEVHRVLKPGGHFILTMDVDVQGAVSIGSDKFYAILQSLQCKFEPVFGHGIVHPQDLLTSNRSPYPMGAGAEDAGAFAQVKSFMRKLITCNEVEASELGCFCGVFRKMK